MMSFLSLSRRMGLLGFVLLGQAGAAVSAGDVHTNTGSNTCAQATIIEIPIGPVGSPATTTILGNNAAATNPDCNLPPGYHDGPIWWEVFRLTDRANVTVELCGTTPVQDPSYDLLVTGCGFANNFCSGFAPPTATGRGAPICEDNNVWSRYDGLFPGVYRIPILSDATVLPGGLGDYTVHIHAEACPGACCHNDEHTCDDCVDAATCNGPGDTYHPDQSCVQVECAATIGPDTMVGFVWDCQHLGRVGPIGSGTVAMSCNTTACNIGDMRGDWNALPDTNHPVIGVNMHRLSTVAGATRFEQIGQGWLKHGFGSSNANECGFGCVPGAPFEQIGVGCSDTYASQQFTSCNLGPRSMIHPYTGAMPAGPSLGQNAECELFTTDGINYPSCDHRDHVHTPISHKVQIPDADLDPLAHPGARYFAEGFYIAPHEYLDGNGNQNNNYAHVEVSVTGPDENGAYDYADLGPYAAESPAVDAWTGSSQSMIEPAPLSDGRAFLNWQVTDLGNGQWHYEYAVFNMNLDASIGSLCVPVGSGVNITNVAFHAPLNHAPEPHADSYSNDPWTPSIESNRILWSTQDARAEPLANAVRFGTLYNFRFDADAPPSSLNGSVGLFKTGGVMPVGLQGPGAGPQADDNLNGIADVCEPPFPPSLMADPADLMSRFISFMPPPTMPPGITQTAIRVKLVSLHHADPPYTGGPSIPFTSFEGQVRWAGPPEQYFHCTASCDTPFQVSPLQCTPHYQDWNTVGLLYVTGSAITPSSVYEVRQVAANCVGIENDCPSVSVPLTVATARWADVDPPFNPPSTTVQPDLADVSALVNRFRNAPGAPIKPRSLLVGDGLDGTFSLAMLILDVDFRHISACVDAFRGRPYPHVIAECP